jgi:uncharacterized OB-fold protein
MQSMPNYADKSTDEGFQFEFYCDRCGQGYRSQFKPFSWGKISGAAEAVSDLFGGVGLFGKTADLTGGASDVRRDSAQDEAFLEAVGEVKPYFVQCPRCANWVCLDNCWNARRGLCQDCASGLKTSPASCPKCGASHPPKAKFCPECGASLKVATHCSQCGAKFQPGAKFCAECGAKLPRI